MSHDALHKYLIATRETELAKQSALLCRIRYSFDERTKNGEESCDRLTEQRKGQLLAYFLNRTIDPDLFQHETCKKGIKGGRLGPTDQDIIVALLQQL